MNRTVKLILVANLILVTILAFVYPHLMIGPGRLNPEHHKIEANCFACHSPFAGVTAERCTACHKPDEIGKITSLGKPIQKPLSSTPFHQKLIRQDCVACHSDHAGVKRFRQNGRFNHDLLQTDSRKECQTCHKPPADSLHRQITENCSQCHTQEKWVPATFDHGKYFWLDRDHNVKCVTCHIQNDYSRYTCYGCHEHSLEKIRRKHIKEGIWDFKDCVDCHRSASEHETQMLDRGGKREKGHGKEKNDN